jgi:hypothetical protein
MPYAQKTHVTKAPERQELTLSSRFLSLGTWVAAHPTAGCRVITGAGLIMAVVFGVLVGAELPVLKMMGSRPT